MVPCAELVVECEADQSELSGLQRLGGRAAAAPHHRAHAASRAEDQIPLSTRGGAGRGTAAFCVHGHLPLGHGVTPASSGGGCQHHVTTYLSPGNVYLLYQTVGIICCGDRIPFLWKDHDFKEDFLHRLTKDNTVG